MSDTREAGDTNVYGGDVLHVFTVEGGADVAEALAGDPERLGSLLGAAVAPGRAEAVDPRALGEIGLAAYLIEGEAADPDAVRPDRERLNAPRTPVLVLLPRAITGAFTAQPPLRHLGSYPLVSAKPAGAPYRPEGGAGVVSGAPPVAVDPQKASRRAQGIVALIATLVALLVALVVWAVAA